MKTQVAALSLGLVFGAFADTAQAGGAIEKACLSSNRDAANRTLCACIQKVANATLSAAEQSRGAKFFADPHQSQEVRASDTHADNLFWEHWQRFGETAAQYCD